jgi:2-hydroxycyclohexanecarboxyl-CoA dehydrogenase
VRFAAEGSLVAVLDRDAAAAQTTVDLISEAGGKAIAYAADITDYAAIVETVAAIEKDLGIPTVLVNNAGFDRFMPFLKTEPKMWEQLIAVNLTGALNMHHVVLPKMLEAGGGKVINVASDAARVGSSGEAVYAACKAGLVGLSKTLARELATKNITLNVVCPGPTDTALLKSVADTSSNRKSSSKHSRTPCRCVASANRKTTRALSLCSPATTPISSPDRSSACPVD